MARAPSKTPHDAPPAAQRFAPSLHRGKGSARFFARSIWGGAFATVVMGAALSCGSSGGSGPGSDTTAYSESAIQDGTTDVTHLFAVGVVQVTQELAFCSGVLLAPNLVATARHCVAQTPQQQIECSTTAFGPLYPVGDLLVTTSGVLSPQADFAHVVQVVVPSGADQTHVCGNDIALMILDRNIELPQYVEPTINPPMTDHSVYATTVTAIGYGISTPLDEAGVTAGTRRIKENIPLYCIPNDTTFANCFSDPMASQVLSADEFVSGDASTCEGDSGSGAYDQPSFNRGQWVAFGVLSRGAVSQDGKTCIQPVYSRFDAWGPLLIQAATEAATMGGYSAPVWAGGTGPTTTILAVDAAASEDAAGGGVVTSKPTPGSLADGKACEADSDCAAQNCVSTNDVTFVCASPCSGGSCTTGFACTSGYCFEAKVGAVEPAVDGAASVPVVTHAKGGCSVSPAQSVGEGGGAASGLAVLALAGVTSGRRRSRSRRSSGRLAARRRA
jgi:V8-like Glu-specific endopeptidase